MKEKKLSIIQEEVLRQIPKGAEKPVRSKEIAERTGLSTREVMAVISVLIIDHSIPIGGSRGEGFYGYYIITNEAERQKAVIPLSRSIHNMTQRVEKLKEIELK